MGADLAKSHLEDCIFPDANLAKASFRSANIEVTRFLGADLNHTDFRGALLSGVDFDKTDLSGADFTNARMDACIFVNTDLRNVKGLSTVIHGGPSSIGIETIFLSGGKISQKFLIGCGVPLHVAEQVPNFVRGSSRKRFYSCFISHSVRDKTFCERLYKSLRNLGVRIWYFPKEAKWGRGVWSEVDAAVRAYDKLIVVCSRSSLVSQPVLREIERALEREDKEGKEVLFPIRLDDYIFDEWKHPRRTDVTKKVVGDFRNWRKPATYKSSVKKLVENLESGSAPRVKSLLVAESSGSANRRNLLRLGWAPAAPERVGLFTRAPDGRLLPRVRRPLAAGPPKSERGNPN